MPAKPDRHYYSRRNTGARSQLDLTALCRLFGVVYQRLNSEHYFDEAFGFYCVDSGDVPGTLGADHEDAVLLALRKVDLWPVVARLPHYSEGDLFDVVEFLFDHVARPVDGSYHSYNDCGWHYEKFDAAEGQERLRADLNPLLRDYGEGFELSSDGEILTLDPMGMNLLLAQEVPSGGVPEAQARLQAAVRKFRRHSASLDDKRDAVRTLFDILEYVRPRLRSVITTKDESDLFNIANNFAIRHHNDLQKSDYDLKLWLPWMFYVYCATLHVVLRILEREPADP